MSLHRGKKGELTQHLGQQFVYIEPSRPPSTQVNEDQEACDYWRALDAATGDEFGRIPMHN